MSRFELSLFENSKGFFQESIRHAVAAEADPHAWKYAITFIVQAIELALKEHLRRAHPLLVFADVDNPKATVTLRKALDRVGHAKLVTLTEKEATAILKANEWRNAVTHYEVSEEVANLQFVYASLLGFYLDYTFDKLDFDTRAVLDDSLLTKLLAIEHYRQELVDRAEARIAADKIDTGLVWICPSCDAGAFVIQDDINTCYVCGFREKVLQCERCNESFFESETHRLDVEWDFGAERYERVCGNCKEELRQEHWGYDDD